MKILWFSRHTFQSPHGDNFNTKYSGGWIMVTLFPSPHGDKFQPVDRVGMMDSFAFPSPHGDKFQRVNMREKAQFIGFRPLTGINFNNQKMKR